MSLGEFLNLESTFERGDSAIRIVKVCASLLTDAVSTSKKVAQIVSEICSAGTECL